MSCQNRSKNLGCYYFILLIFLFIADDRNNRFNSGGDRRHRGPRRDSGARSSDESPVKHREDITKKRKLVTYTEPEEFDF